MSESRRKELSEYLETGRLRDDVAYCLSVAAQDLLVDIVSRYCAPRRSRRRRKSRDRFNPRDVAILGGGQSL